MDLLDWVISATNLQVIKSRLNIILDKMCKQESPNLKLKKEFEDSILRLDESYVNFNLAKELTFMHSKRSKDLEQLLIDLTIKLKEKDRIIDEKDKQIEILKENINF